MPYRFDTEQLIRDPDAEIRKTLTWVIHHCPKSREQLADELTRRVGVTVTVHMLNNYTAEGKRPARFPAAFIPAFCEITGDDTLRHLVLGSRLDIILELGERALTAMYKERPLRALVEDIRKIEQGFLNFER